MNKRTPTVRTSTVWPFLYTLSEGRLAQVVYDAAAPKMAHVAASAPTPREKRKLEGPTRLRRRTTNTA